MSMVALVVHTLPSTVNPAVPRPIVHGVASRTCTLSTPCLLPPLPSVSPMTVAPRKKTLDEIYDIDELEKMVKFFFYIFKMNK